MLNRNNNFIKIISIILALFFTFTPTLIYTQSSSSEKKSIQYFNEGVTLYKEGNYQKAIDVWEKIPESSKNYEKAQKNIRIAKSKIKKEEEKEEEREEKLRHYEKIGRLSEQEFQIYSAYCTEEELRHYEKIREKYKRQQQERIDRYRAEIEKRGRYKNLLSKKGTLYPLVKEAALRSLIPGFGQFYNRRKIRGFIYLTSEIAALTSFIIYRTRGNDYEEQYNKTENRDDLINSTSYNKAVDNIKYSNTSLWFLYGIPVVAMLDAVIDAAITGSSIKSKLLFSNKINEKSYSISLSYSF